MLHKAIGIWSHDYSEFDFSHVLTDCGVSCSSKSFPFEFIVRTLSKLIFPKTEYFNVYPFPLDNVGFQGSRMCHKYSTVKGLQDCLGGAGGNLKPTFR